MVNISGGFIVIVRKIIDSEVPLEDKIEAHSYIKKQSVDSKKTPDKL